jgi:hypothetical protein
LAQPLVVRVLVFLEVRLARLVGPKLALLVEPEVVEPHLL